MASDILGGEERYGGLFELNAGLARLGDAVRVLVTPDLIWPSLRLKAARRLHIGWCS